MALLDAATWEKANAFILSCGEVRNPYAQAHRELREYVQIIHINFYMPAPTYSADEKAVRRGSEWTFDGTDSMLAMGVTNDDLKFKSDNYVPTFGHIDAISADVMMPGADGFELARNIRATDAEIPILFMTALDDMPSMQRGYRIGIDDYMVKPVNLDELLLRIGALMRRAKISTSHRLEVGGSAILAQSPVVTHPLVSKKGRHALPGAVSPYQTAGRQSPSQNPALRQG